MTAKELREARARLITQSRELVDLAGTEDRELTTEEDTRFSQLLDEADGMKLRYEQMETLEAQERDLATSQGPSPARPTRTRTPTQTPPPAIPSPG
jgi:hypothetical protein